MALHDYRNMVTTYRGPEWASPPLAPTDLAYLNPNNPRLQELRGRYAGHQATAHTQWKEREILRDLNLSDFRGNHYVHQMRNSPSSETYYVTAYYVRDHDKLNLFGHLTEDGMFGAFTLPFDDGYIISRDLLDSINEINFIYRMLGKSADQGIRLLDIGAGYGRLAHRLAEGFPSASIVCTDAVPLSTFLSEFYLRFRGVHERVEVVPLDRAEMDLAGRSFDVVTNIHSFSECPQSAIGWWLRLLSDVDVARLMIIPNARDQFRSTEPDGSHQDFTDMLTSSGWRLTHKEPIFQETTVAHRCGLYPNFGFFWFERA